MQKASRWNSAIVFALLWFVSAPVTAQDAQPLGVLLTAPVFRRGIDWLPANVLPHWVATYRIALAGATVETQVVYVDTPVEAARSWAAAPCQLRRLRESGDGAYYYESVAGWSILVTAAPMTATSTTGVSPSVVCEFVDLFVTRFQFFQNSRAPAVSSAAAGQTRSDTGARPPDFPAILNSGR